MRRWLRDWDEALEFERLFWFGAVERGAVAGVVMARQR